MVTGTNPGHKTVRTPVEPPGFRISNGIRATGGPARPSPYVYIPFNLFKGTAFLPLSMGHKHASEHRNRRQRPVRVSELRIPRERRRRRGMFQLWRRTPQPRPFPRPLTPGQSTLVRVGGTGGQGGRRIALLLSPSRRDLAVRRPRSVDLPDRDDGASPPRTGHADRSTTFARIGPNCRSSPIAFARIGPNCQSSRIAFPQIGPYYQSSGPSVALVRRGRATNPRVVITILPPVVSV